MRASVSTWEGGEGYKQNPTNQKGQNKEEKQKQNQEEKEENKNERRKMSLVLSSPSIIPCSVVSHTILKEVKNTKKEKKKKKDQKYLPMNYVV